MAAQWQADFGSIWDTCGWQIAWGKAVQHMRTPYEGRSGGVAIIARAGIPFCCASVGFGDAKAVLHVFSVYGYTNSRTWCPEIMAKNEALLRDVFEAAAGLSNVHIVILGDLNVPIDMSSAIQSSIATGRWGDAAAAVAQARGIDPDNTCFVWETSKGSRIDAALCNSPLMQTVVNSYVVRDTGLPTHLPVCVELILPESRQLVDVVHRPMAIPLDFACADEEQEHRFAKSVAQRILASSSEAWEDATASSNVEALWLQWSPDAERYLLDRKACVMTCNRKCYQGRCVVSIHRKQARVATQQPETGAMPLHTRHLWKLARRLEDRQMHAMSLIESPIFGCNLHRWLHLWTLSRTEGISLLNDQCLLAAFSQAPVPTIDILQDISAYLRQAVATGQSSDRHHRVNAWKSWLREDWANTGSGVHKWCKGDSGSRVSLMQRPDGTLTVNAEEMDELVHAVWMPILRMYTNKPEPSWDAFRSRFGVHFPSTHVMPKQRLTVKSLRGTLQRMKKSSACGPDGWRVAELLALPDIFLEQLVDILCIVERTGIWANDLAQGFITLIPKGEGSELANLRPISVMSVIYRAWAGTRLRELLEWQDSWVSDNLHGYRPRHGPEHVWWILELRIERALIEGTDLAGISLDYAKCFDRVPSIIVFRLARESGMSEDILKPLEGMFKQLRRRFAIGGGVGK